jgi:hypothetical protein
MNTLRSHLVPHPRSTTGPTAFMTERNDHEVRCGMCARPVYVDEETYWFVSDAMKTRLNNPVLCEVCEQEYDELAYEE